jgi:predicted acylesterase/phospholipase RssA
MAKKRRVEGKGENGAKGQPKRAICLAGGGPAAGLHIGVLKGLRDAGITFDTKNDVWALSCIGAWVGVIYNQAEKDRIQETTNFFRDVFREDKSFDSFPLNTIFTPDWAGNADAMWEFLIDPKSYKSIFLPKEIMKSFMYTASALRRMSLIRRSRRRHYNGDFDEIAEFGKDFSEGDFNRWTLNHVLAVHPVVRLLTALIYKSKITGRSRLYYPDSSFLNNINFDKLKDDEKPFIYHNAWNLTHQKLVLFANRPKRAAAFPDEAVTVEGYRSPINAASLCACSALPFIEQTVTIDREVYCEGALVDTVNFRNLLEDNPDLDEIWVSRLIDANQILPPRDLYDAEANLCELFAATVGKDDVKLFEYHLTCDEEHRGKWKNLTVVEIPVSCDINFDWSHSNLERGIKNGVEAATRAVHRYHQPRRGPGPWILKEHEEFREARTRQRLKMAQERCDLRTS